MHDALLYNACMYFETQVYDRNIQICSYTLIDYFMDLFAYPNILNFKFCIPTIK